MYMYIELLELNKTIDNYMYLIIHLLYLINIKGEWNIHVVSMSHSYNYGDKR